jgi:hypothetical protein
MTMGAMPRAGAPFRRKPVRSLAEIADEFGISRHTPQAHMSNSRNAPKPEFQHKSTPTMPGRSYYRLNDMRKWWAEYQKVIA